MRRALMRTRPASLRSLSRIVPQVASANWVWARPTRRGEPEPELVGAHCRGRGAVGEQVALAFLDPVLHLAAGAVDLLVEEAAVGLGSFERGDDEARIGLALRPLRLADHPAPAGPAVARRVAEVLEAAGGLAGRCRRRRRLGEFGFDLRRQPGVAGKPEHEVDPVLFAPGHPRLAGEAGVGAQKDVGQRARIWPTIRAISSTAPALASMFAGRSLAARRCRPQNT